MSWLYPRRGKILPAIMLLLLAGCGTMPPKAEPAAQPVSALHGVTVQAPPWRVGSQWQYSDGYGMKVMRVDGPVTRFQRLDDPTQWIERRGFLREDSQSGTALRKLVFEDLPQGSGSVLSSDTPLTYRREYMSGDVQRVHATSWTVEGQETVKVPAGTFDCYVLVMRTRNLSEEWTGFERWWYSPQAQNYVRMEYRYGPATTGSRVLMRYSLEGSPPTPLK